MNGGRVGEGKVVVVGEAGNGPADFTQSPPPATPATRQTLLGRR